MYWRLGTSAQAYVVHNCQDILPGMFIVSFFFLLCAFSLHNMNSDVHFSSSVLSSYTFFPEFNILLYAFSPHFSSLLFQMFSPLLDIEFLRSCLFITSTTVFFLLTEVINGFSSVDNVTPCDPHHKIFSPSTFKV
jgi:hypothetical protein